MSQETLARAKRVMDALRRRDLSRLLSFADPEVEWQSLFAELGEGGSQVVARLTLAPELAR